MNTKKIMCLLSCLVMCCSAAFGSSVGLPFTAPSFRTSSLVRPLHRAVDVTNDTTNICECRRCFSIAIPEGNVTCAPNCQVNVACVQACRQAYTDTMREALSKANLNCRAARQAYTNAVDLCLAQSQHNIDLCVQYYPNDPVAQSDCLTQAGVTYDNCLDAALRLRNDNFENISLTFEADQARAAGDYWACVGNCCDCE